MVTRIRLRRMGGSVGATIPKEMAERMQVSEGDELFAVETDRGILLTPYDPQFERAMRVYEEGARKYRNALRELSE